MSPKRKKSGQQSDGLEDVKVSTTLSSVPMNVLFVVSCRIVTFILNGLLLRSVSPTSLGVMNVRLLLIYSSTQFMSREPFRKAITTKGETKQVAFAFLSIPLGLVYGLLFYILWTRWLVTPDNLHGYSFASLLMVTSVLVELIAEPFFLLAQSQCKFFLRIFAEGLSLILRCTTLVAFVTFTKDDQSRQRHILTVFGLGQLFGSTFYTLVFLWYFRSNTWKVFSDFTSTIRTNRHLISLTSSFMKQTIIKQLLTEGEKFVMTFFNPLSFAEQGVYDVINNLASLAARLIFAPIEESSFLIFSSIVDRRKEGQAPIRDQLTKSWSLLSFLLKSMTLVGLVIFTFGFNLSQSALIIYAGRTFAEGTIAPTLLRCQTLYILIISLNGVSESFTTAAMNQDDLAYFNGVLSVLSVIFVATSLILTRILGPVGLIFANSLNMFGRVVHSVRYMSKFFGRDFRMTSLIPTIQTWITLMSVFALLAISESYLCCPDFVSLVSHVMIAGILFISSTVIAYFYESDIFQSPHLKSLLGNVGAFSKSK